MSAILSADALNDFISPGVACIKPVETLPASSPDGDPNEVIIDGQQSSSPVPPVNISLTDCLACSGCVTSAEAVLVSLQSHAEVLSALDSAPGLRVARRAGQDGYDVEGGRVACCRDDGGRGGGGGGGGGGEGARDGILFVASVSPQTRASLAAACGRGVGEREAGYMLEHLLRGPEGLAAAGKWKNGFAYVVDTNAAREACLVLGADEVLPGSENSSQTQRPVLTASCPGWVCYAEKTHPHVLPHLSRVKSPQALTGTLLKTVLSRRLGIPPSKIWHLAVMPCFDKKLEASREELTDVVWGGDGAPGRGGIRDVDCVVTSKEILMIAESRGIDFFGLPKRPPPAGPDSSSPFPDPVISAFLFPPRGSRQAATPDAGSSGGNLYFILRTLVSRNPGSRIDVARGRNADVAEYTVVSASGDPLFRAARYYGFRNIQNLVRKLKPARPSRVLAGKTVGGARRPGGKPAAGLEYSYVEVMACPGGCTNGGGQIKVDDAVVASRLGYSEQPGPQEQKDWLAAVDEAYFSADEAGTEGGGANASGLGGGGDEVVCDISAAHVRDVLEHWSRSTGIDMGLLALTTFREVVSDVGKDAAATTDAERVARLAGKIGGGW